MKTTNAKFMHGMRVAAAAFMAPLLAATAYGFSAPVHEAEMADVFARIEGTEFREAANRISSAIDNDLLESFRKNIGKVPGNHRIIGHGWTLDGHIPKDVLKELEKANPGRAGDIAKWWSQEARQLTGLMERATGLPAKQAQALAGLHWDMHLLGDRMPGNKLVERVLTPQEIERNIEKNCDILFKNRPEYAKAVRKALRKALAKGGSEADQAARLMQAMQREIPFSEMLSRCWGRTLARRGIIIAPRGAASVTTERFLTALGISLPKTAASEAAKKAANGAGREETANVFRGKTPKLPKPTVLRAMNVHAVALPVVAEVGFFFYDEHKNRAALGKGERTREEAECITYQNVGRHGAAIAGASAGAAFGASWCGTGGAVLGSGFMPGVGTMLGGGVGSGMGVVLGGIGGALVGEICGAKGGEWAYLAKAKRGAERGDPAANFFLGGYHYSRIKPGKAKHVAEARLYLERAADGGSAKAGVFLGKMFWDGTGLPADKPKAVTLWRTAAERGDEDGMYLLARALLAGEGTETDIEAGHAFMREAAARGCELAIDAYPETDRLYQAWCEEHAECAARTEQSPVALRPVPAPPVFMTARMTRKPNGGTSGWVRPARRIPRTRVC